VRNGPQRFVASTVQSTEAIAVPAILAKRIAKTAVMIGIAASLCGCAARPLSFEERPWFDRAIGYDLARHPSPAFSPPQVDPYFGAPGYPR
jgi:hypothetical protein